MLHAEAQWRWTNFRQSQHLGEAPDRTAVYQSVLIAAPRCMIIFETTREKGMKQDQKSSQKVDELTTLRPLPRQGLGGTVLEKVIGGLEEGGGRGVA